MPRKIIPTIGSCIPSTDQIERLLLGVLLIFLGGALVSGILKPLTLEMVLFSMFFFRWRTVCPLEGKVGHQFLWYQGHGPCLLPGFCIWASFL